MVPRAPSVAQAAGIYQILTQAPRDEEPKGLPLCLLKRPRTTIVVALRRVAVSQEPKITKIEIRKPENQRPIWALVAGSDNKRQGVPLL